MEYKFIIEGRLPSLNQFISANRTKAFIGNQMKQENQRIVCAYIRKYKLHPIHSKVTLKYTFYEPNSKRDLDNISSFARKVIQDALVECGILENDGWKNISGSSEEFYIDKENPRIEVTIKEE